MGCRNLLASRYPCTVRFAGSAAKSEWYRLLSLVRLCCETPQQSICRTKHGPLSASSDDKGLLLDKFLLGNLSPSSCAAHRYFHLPNMWRWMTRGLDVLPGAWRRIGDYALLFFLKVTCFFPNMVQSYSLFVGAKQHGPPGPWTVVGPCAAHLCPPPPHSMVPKKWYAHQYWASPPWWRIYCEKCCYRAE